MPWTRACCLAQSIDQDVGLDPSVVLEAERVLVRTVVRSARLTLLLVEELPTLNGARPLHPLPLFSHSQALL